MDNLIYKIPLLPSKKTKALMIQLRTRDIYILSGEIKPIQYTIIGFGLIAGLISSLAVSGLILMVEKVTAVPVGTFYMVLMAALLSKSVIS